MMEVVMVFILVELVVDNISGIVLRMVDLEWLRIEEASSERETGSGREAALIYIVWPWPRGQS